MVLVIQIQAYVSATWAGKEMLATWNALEVQHSLVVVILVAYAWRV